MFSNEGTKKIQITLNFYQNLLGSLAGFELSLSDLFRLGVAMEDTEYIRIDIDEVRLTSDTTAMVEGVVNLLNGGEMEASPTWFYMVEKDGDWFIQNMKDAPEKDSALASNEG